MPATAALRRAVWFGATLLGGSLVSALAAQQRSLVPITNSSEDHMNPVMSPNGQLVAFRGASKIGLVPYGGGAEVVLAAGSNLGSFVWTPDSRGIYYLDGTQLYFVGASGGLPRPLYVLPEAGHQLWDVKDDDSELFGTWLYVRNNGSTTIRESQIFVMRTDGTVAPRVITQTVLNIDGVRISPDQTKIAYRQYDSAPFTPHDFFVANIDGTGAVSLTGSLGFGLNPTLPLWDPNNTGVFCARTDRALSRSVIERFSLTSTIRVPFSYPTPARNPSISQDGSWVIYEGYWPGGTTWTPVVMPIDGGGHVFLDTSRTLTFTGAPVMGGTDRVVLTANLAGGANAQVLKCELARELVVRPLALVGTAVNVELPVLAGESGVVMLAAAPLATPIELSGFAGGFQLDPAAIVTVLSGIGNGSALTVQLPIPNINYLRRKAVYLQALRLLSLSQGDFTRLVELPMF
jgi:Tol biopolymer transport system component